MKKSYSISQQEPELNNLSLWHQLNESQNHISYLFMSKGPDILKGIPYDYVHKYLPRQHSTPAAPYVHQSLRMDEEVGWAVLSLRRPTLRPLKLTLALTWVGTDRCLRLSHQLHILKGLWEVGLCNNTTLACSVYHEPGALIRTHLISPSRTWQIVEVGGRMIEEYI